jgi:hypothetical protein
MIWLSQQNYVQNKKSKIKTDQRNKKSEKRWEVTATVGLKVKPGMHETD